MEKKGDLTADSPAPAPAPASALPYAAEIQMAMALFAQFLTMFEPLLQQIANSHPAQQAFADAQKTHAELAAKLAPPASEMAAN